MRIDDIMQQPSDNKFLARFYSLWISIWWLYWFVQKGLLHIPDGVSYVATDIDPVVVILNNFGLVHAFLQNKILCYLVDFSIPVLAIVAWFKPMRGFPFLLLLVALALFDIGYAALTFHRQHGLYGLVIMALPFCFIGKVKEFSLIWRAARYIPIFLYLIAFYWKLKGGAFLHPMQGVTVVKDNLAALLVERESSFYARSIAFFLTHPVLLDILVTLGFLAEGAFVVALFTKRFDIWLIVLAVLLHLMIIYFVDANFVQHLIVLLPLLPLEKVRHSKFYRYLTW